MRPLVWDGDARFAVAGLEFDCSPREPSPDRLAIFKQRWQVEFYGRRLHGLRNVLEFGVHRGGSAAFLAAAFDLDRYVGIDLSPPVAAFDAWRDRHPLGQRMRIHYGTGQDDAARIRAIVAEDFAGAPIDLVIDDASHDYALSKATFEAAFPLLKPGGAYLIEDWGWAHDPVNQGLWPGRPALTNLVFELTMACAGSPHLVARVEVEGAATCIVRKAQDAPVGEELSLDRLYRARGRRLTPL